MTAPQRETTEAASTVPRAPAARSRYHGLDWLRAVAALSVIALHAGIAYTIRPFPGLVWPVHDPRPSPLVDAATWWVDTWIMPVFFMMGGLLAAHLFSRLSPGDFLMHRVRRLLYPLVFGMVVILPASLYVWLLGWVVEGRIRPVKLRSLHLGETGRGLWGVGHLWFLEYLFLFCAGAWLLHRTIAWVAGRAAQRDTDRPIALRFPRSAFRSPLSLVLLAACSTLALWWAPQIVIGFRHAWHPLPANLLYYAPCFTAGWWMMRHCPNHHRGVRIALAGLIASPLLLAAALPLIHAHATVELTGTPRFAMVVFFVACGWATALSAVRLSLRPCAPPPQCIVYLAQASFWMYLFHHPVVGLAQVALHGSALPAVAKFTIVWTSGTVLSLLTYEVCVRRTWIGALLSGRRDASRTRQDADESLRTAA